MEMAVETERGGKRFYEAVSADATDENLKRLFGFLAAEEDRHIAAFQEVARTVKEHPHDLAYNWEEAAQYLDAIVESKYFLGTGKALRLAGESKTPAQALDHAIAFEKETLLFYSEVLGMVAAATRPAVSRLIAEEKSHIVKLTELRRSLVQG